jgi:serine/threonine protein kinase
MENYRFIEKIGSGTHGTAYLLQSQNDNKYVVCKSVIQKHFKHAHKEISILSKLNHRKVVKMIDNIQVKESIYIILEYANYGTLETMISYFAKYKYKCNLTLMWSILSQITDALYYLHSKKIIHRDIKPSNILINKFSVKENEYLEFKICDFSLSTSYDKYIEDKGTVGTPFYMAPEIVSKSRYDATVDMWSLGVSLYEVLTLKKPFAGANRDELYSNILSKKIAAEELSEDRSLTDIILQCLSKKDRITSKNLCKNEKIRLNLTMLELKYRESKIEKLELKIKELEAKPLVNKVM